MKLMMRGSSYDLVLTGKVLTSGLAVLYSVGAVTSMKH